MSRTAALVLALCVAACGLKGAPQPPELVRPTPPTNLTAVGAPDGIKVSWLRPQRYTGGKRMEDLGSFLIERAPGDGSAPEFALVHTFVLDDQHRFRQQRRLSWTDTTATKGTRYLYRITAETLDGSRSAVAGPVAAVAGEVPPAATTEPPAKAKPKKP